ncbi:MAG: arylsulfatase A-like enzyme [Pirellulaceae bacterium]|jgi:arylsulfatase A-like enzyme
MRFQPRNIVLLIAFNIIAFCAIEAAVAQAPSILYGHHSKVEAAAFSPDGNHFYTSGADGEIICWDSATLKPLGNVKQKVQRSSTVAGANDGGTAFAGDHERLVRIHKIANGDLQAAKEQPKRVNAIALSPDNSTVIVGGGVFASRGFGRLVSATDASVKVDLEGHRQTVCAVAWTDDNARVATGGGRFARAGEVKVFTSADGKLIADLSAVDAIQALDFAPDNNLLAAGGRDNVVHLYNVDEKKIVADYFLPTGGVLAVAFNEDGTRLSAVNRQGTIRTWDVESRRVINSYNTPNPIDTVAAFSPNAEKLITGSMKGLVQVWELESLVNIRQASPLTNLFRHTATLGCNAPNIVVIVADDLGYGDLGSYGQEMIRTPNIDRLAHNGLQFANYYAGTSTGTASRCSFWTGLHTGHTRLRGNKELPLRPEDVTVAELLAASGYVTGTTGKWSLGQAQTTGSPNRQGFLDAFGYTQRRRAELYYPDFLWNNEERFEIAGNQNGDRKAYSQDLVTDAAIRFIEVNYNRPFFLHVAYSIPHANTALGQQTGNGLEVPLDSPYSAQNWPQVQKNYAAMITRMDEYVGQICRTLEDLDLLQDTVIFITSDNGPHKEGGADPQFFNSAGDLRGIKQDLYEGGIRVPMIVHWPRRIAGGRISGEHFGHFDFMPTALDIAGANVRAGKTDGISMLNTMRGAPPSSGAPRILYFENHDGPFRQAIRNGRWKAIREGLDGPIELYDIPNDPTESTNVAHLHPDVVQQATDLFPKLRTQSTNWPVVGE